MACCSVCGVNRVPPGSCLTVSGANRVPPGLCLAVSGANRAPPGTVSGVNRVPPGLFMHAVSVSGAHRVSPGAVRGVNRGPPGCLVHADAVSGANRVPPRAVSGVNRGPPGSALCLASALTSTCAVTAAWIDRWRQRLDWCWLLSDQLGTQSSMTAPLSMSILFRGIRGAEMAAHVVNRCCFCYCSGPGRL